MQWTRARGAGGGQDTRRGAALPALRRRALLLLPLAAAALAAGAVAAAHVDHGPPGGMAAPPAGDVHGPPWPWLGGPWDRAAVPSLLPEAEARRVAYLTASFRVTGHQTITATYSAPIYAHSSDYTGLRIDSGNGLESRNVCGLSGPSRTSGWGGIRTTPSQTHTLTICGDGKPDGGRLPPSASGRINVAQLYYFYAGNIFDGNSVHRYFLRSSNVFVADGQAPSLTTSGGGAPHLNLEDEYLRLGLLNERMDASRINLHGITLSCDPASGAASIALGNMSGAALPAADASTVEIVLSPGQKNRLVDAANGQCSGAQWRVSLGPSTLFDAAGNAMPPASNVALGVTVDTQPPRLSGNPTLDLSSGVMTVGFDEYVEAAGNADAVIGVKNADGGSLRLLGGASVAVSGDTATITLTERQRLDMVVDHAETGRLIVNIPRDAFSDLAGHRFDTSAGNSTIIVAPDLSPPGLLAGTPPSLDLNGTTGRLSLLFDENVNVGATNLTGVRLLGPGSSVLAMLDGLSARAGGTALQVGGDTYSMSVEVVLNETLRADSIGAARITAPPGAFSDAAGNSHTGLSAFPLNVTADTTRPSVVGRPALDLNDGTLAVKFDEFVGKVRTWAIVLLDDRRLENVVLGGASVLPTPEGSKYTDTVVVNLTRGQAAEAAAANVSRIDANPATFEDIAGNRFTGLVDITLNVTADTTDPVLDAARPPRLSTSAGTLVLSFSEYVNASAIVASGIAVTGPNGVNSVTLTNAETPSADGDVVSIGLAGHNTDIAGQSLPRELDISAGAFRDMSRNTIDLVENLVISSEVDAGRPGLASTSPSLNLNTLNLTLRFNETIRATQIDPSGISVGPAGAFNRTHLAGASAAAGAGNTVAVVGITEEQKALIITARARAGAPELYIDILPSAVADTAGNHLVEVINASITPVVSDTTDPQLNMSAPPVLDLATGSLTVWFDEHMNASLTKPVVIELIDSANKKSVKLDEETRVVLPPPGSPTQSAVALMLTPAQKAKAVTINASWITSGSNPNIDGAFSDLSGNAIGLRLGGPVISLGETPGFEMSVVKDAAAPRLLASVPPLLNMSDGTLTLRFNEHVAAADAVPGLVELAAGAQPGQPRIALGSSAVSIPYVPVVGSPPPTSSDTIVVTLSPHEKAAAAAVVASGGSVVLGPGAFSDVSGNPNVALSAALSIENDTVGPGIEEAELELGAGILTVRFSEYVNASATDLSGVSLSGAACPSGIDLAGASPSAGAGAHPAAPPGTSPAVAISLTEAQRVAAAACWTTPGTSEMAMAPRAGAFRDMSSQPSRYYSESIPILVLSDAAAPRLDSSVRPSLDLDAGNLTIRFSEHVNASAADPSLVSLSGAACPSGIGLAGASVYPDAAAAAVSPPAPPGASPVAVISLTEAQRAAAAACWTAPETRAMDVSALRGAFPDVSWNPSAAFAAARASVANDTTAPTLADASSVPPPILLNLEAKTISFTFDEHVVAASAIPSRVTVTDRSGGTATPLLGAAVRGSGGPTLVLSLLDSQVSQITLANSSSNGPVKVNIESGAFSDVSGNPIGDVSGQAVAFSNDKSPPSLAGRPTLHLGDGTLTVRFNEPVLSSTVNASGIFVHPYPPSGAVAPARLAGAAVVAAPGGDQSAIGLILTPDQKAASMVAHAPGNSSELQMAPASVADLALNDIMGTSARLNVTQDGSPPALSAARPPRLDLGDGVLTLHFDEYVSSPSANASRMWLLPAGASEPEYMGAVRLAPATPFTDDPDSDVIRVQLTPDLKAVVAASQRVRLGAGAVSDLSNNPMASALAALSVARDLAAPRLADSALPILNLSSGVLTVVFDEHVDASSANLSRLSIVDASGTRVAALGGANLVSGDGASIDVRLTPAQHAASVAEASSEPVRLVAHESGALSDLSGNPLGTFGPSPMLVVPDTVGPMIVNSGDRRPALDLGTGILAVSFDERVDAGASNLSAVRLVTTSGTVVARLGGYGDDALAAGDASLDVALSPSDLDEVIDDAFVGNFNSRCDRDNPIAVSSIVRTEVRLEAGAGAFYDALGNPSAPLAAAELRVGADETSPSLDAALLNTANHSIVLTFDERVYLQETLLGDAFVENGSHRAELERGLGHPVARLEHVGDGRVRITEGNVANVAALDGDVRISLPADSFMDLSCNTFGSVQRAAMSTASDNSPPQMLARYPKLDLGSANLTMKFNEPVDAAGVDALAVSLSNATGWRIQLGGAAVSAPDDDATNKTVILSLTPPQKHAAVVANLTGPIYVSVTDEAVPDLSYLYYAGLENGNLYVTPDTAPPRMLGGQGDQQRRPTLDIPARTLTVHFDEYVDVDATSAMPGLAEMLADGQSTPDGVRLDPVLDVEAVVAPGSPVVGTAGQSLAITLGEAKVLDAVVEAVSRLSAPEGAFYDAANNTGADGPVRMLVLSDLMSPSLVVEPAPRLYLGNGTLVLAFDEPVNASAGHASGITLQGEQRSVELKLSNPAPGAGPGGLDRTVVVRLTLPDKAAAAVASPSSLSLTAGAFVDASHNLANNASNVPLIVERDTDRPGLAHVRNSSLDLEVGTVRMYLDEHVNATTSSPLLASISGGGSRIDLSGALSVGPWFPPLQPGAAQNDPLSRLQRDPDAVGAPAFEVVLTERQRAAAVVLRDAAVPGSPSLDVPENAFRDLAGNNNSAASRPLDVTRDVTGPALDIERRQVLHLGNGTLTVWLDEYANASATVTSKIEIVRMDDRQRVGLGGVVASVGPGEGGAGVPPLPAYASLSVNIPLEAAQKAEAVVLVRQGGDMQLVAERGAFRDLSKNPSPERDEFPLVVNPDGMPPMLDGDPLLNLAARKLVLTFDEYVDAGAVNTSRIEVVGAGAGAPRVALDNSTVLGPNGTSITLDLDAGQLAGIASAYRTDPSVRLDMAPGAVRDLSGIGIGRVTGAALAVTSDIALPALSDPPGLDLNYGTLLLRFSEPVGAGVDLRLMNLTAVAGTAGAQPPPPAGLLGLVGATPAAQDSNATKITLTARQKAVITAAYLAAGGSLGGARVVLDVGAGAVEDLVFNGIAELRARPVVVTPDTTRPSPDDGSHDLELGGGTLAVRFDEHVDTNETSTDRLRLAWGPGGAGVALDGASPAPSPATGSPLVNVTLTPYQKAAVVAARDAASDFSLKAETDAFWDLSGNPSGNASVALRVLADMAPPRLAGDRDPLLNLAAGTLTLAFDEYVDAGSVVASAIEVVVGTGGAGTGVALRDATVEGSDGTSITLVIGAGHLAHINSAIENAGAEAPPVLLYMEPGAVRDLSNNDVARVSGVPLVTTSDADPPDLLSGRMGPALDLNDGTLLLRFSETVGAGVDLRLMNLTAAAGTAGAQPPAGLLGLVGATPAVQDSNATKITLTVRQKAVITAAYIAAGGAPGGARVVLDIGAGAVEDLAFNGIDEVRASAVAVTPDTRAPAGVSHRLDLGAGALEVRFDEHVNTSATKTDRLSLAGGSGGAPVSLAGASAAPSPATGSPLVNVMLTPAQKASAADAARLEAPSGAFADLSGNPSGEVNATLAVAPDGTPPRLAAGSPPLLNLAAGTLTLTFDEYVNEESVEASRMTIRDAGGDEAAVLAGAQVDGPVRDDVTLVMTAAQAAAVSRAHGSDPPVNLDLAQGAVQDLSGNGFAGASGVELETTSDIVRPALLSGQRGPALDLNDGALSVRFSEPVAAGRIALERFAIALAETGERTTPGAAPLSVHLGGADLDVSRAADDGSVAIGLTAAQKAFADGAVSAGAEIELRLEAGAVYDLARNRNDNASAPLAVTPDTSPPAPSAERRPDLDLNGGTLRVEFNEYIDAESVRPGLVSVAGTALGGANASVSGAAVLLALTPAQKAAAVLAASSGDAGDGNGALSASGGGAVAVTIAAGAAADLSGNAAGMHAGLDARTVPDTTPPRLLESRPPVFDAAAATLALAFDEYVNASSVAPSRISAEDSSGGSRVTLEGAAARGPDSALVVLDLSAGQVAAIAAAHASAPPVRLDVAPGSLRDLSGNVFAGADDVGARLAATPPAPPPEPPDGGGGGTAPPPAVVGPVVQAPSQPAAVFGGGGGGGGRTLVEQPGASTADPVAIRTVSWDCEAGLATVVLGGARAAEANVRIATASGSAWAEPGDAPPGGGAAYSAPFAGDRHISVRVEVAEGGTVRMLVEAVGTGGQCAGEAVVTPPSAAPAPGGDAAAGAQPDSRAADGADGPAGDRDAPPGQPGAGGGPEPGREGAEPPDADGNGSGPGAEPAPEPSPEVSPLAIPPPPPDDREAEAGAGEGQEPPDAGPGTDAGDDAGTAGSEPGEAPPAGGGCLVATAAYGTELAPQVQALREVRDTALASTPHGSALLAAFNTAYYSFSPHVADLERSSPAARAAAGAAIAPLVWILHAAAQAGEGHGAGDALTALAAAGVLAAAAAAAVVAVRTGAAPALRLRPAARAY